MKPSAKVLGWLDALPGARVIITSEEFRLDASEIEGFPPDPARFVASELPLVAGEIEEMLGELNEMEARSWEPLSSPESELLDEVLEPDAGKE
jgi:hypothetical protein